MASGSILDIAVSTPPTSYATYTPSPVAAFANGLGCTVGQLSPTSAPDLVACAMSNTASNADGPFLDNLTAGESGGAASLSLNWAAAPFSATQPLTCPAGSAWAMDNYVEFGAPLFDDNGYSYVSDDHSMARYTPGGSGGTGTCAWGQPNPAHAALISWNAIALPANQGYQGGYYLVGQGIAGPVVLANYLSGEITNTLWLTDTQGNYYNTFNTVSAVETPTGARLYDSTAQCPTDGGCDPHTLAPGRLYAIDITSPTTLTGTPTMTVAFSYTLTGPSGASPMVLEHPSQGCSAPCGDQIYFDGSVCVANCQSSTPTLHPTLYGLRDLGGSSTAPLTPTQLFAINMNQYTTDQNNESGYCPVTVNGKTVYVYRGIPAAPGLQAPETSGSNTTDDSVWAYVTCGPTLYRFDAQTGALWSGAGQSSIDIASLSGLQNYMPSSAIMTVKDANTGDTTMFMGAQQEFPTKDSYVTALDLETGKMFWKMDGPTNVGSGSDTPFQGQLPIARTAAGGNILIASTAGVHDGSSIIAIPLS